MSISSNRCIRFLGTGLIGFLMISLGHADDPQSEARVKEALEITTSAAKDYRFKSVDQPQKQFAMHPKSILHWSNPVAGEIYGNVFVWTDQGRPAVIGSIYKWYSPETHSSHEFQSLSINPVKGKGTRERAWKTSQGGVEFQTVPDQPAFSNEKRVRERYAKALSKRFKIRKTDRKNVSRNLRLLEQPVYRYGDENSDVLDGSLFVFAQGTDPEAFLMIEARKVDGKLEWQYALARMNSVQFVATYRDQKVWEAKTLPWKDVKSGSEPYTSFGPFK